MLKMKGVYLVEAIVETVYTVAVTAVNTVRVAFTIEFDAPTLLTVTAPLCRLQGTQLRCHHRVFI